MVEPDFGVCSGLFVCLFCVLIVGVGFVVVVVFFLLCNFLLRVEGE